jgi:hypothetical protein
VLCAIVPAAYRYAYDRAESADLGPLWSGLRGLFGLKTDIVKRPGTHPAHCASSDSHQDSPGRRGCLKILFVMWLKTTCDWRCFCHGSWRCSPKRCSRSSPTKELCCWRRNTGSHPQALIAPSTATFRRHRIEAFNHGGFPPANTIIPILAQGAIACGSVETGRRIDEPCSHQLDAICSGLASSRRSLRAPDIFSL